MADANERNYGERISSLEGSLPPTRDRLNDLHDNVTGVRNKLDAAEASLRSEIQGVETTLRMEIQGVETTLRTEMKSFETTLRTDIAKVADTVGATDKKFQELDRRLTQRQSTFTIGVVITAVLLLLNFGLLVATLLFNL